MEKSSLVYLGNLNTPITEIVAEATKFFGFCYSILEGENMSEKRYHAWLRKTSSGKLSSAPKLSSLPPTTEAFTQNVLRAHCQCAIWLSTLSPDPPNIDPANFGWKRDEDNECLVPVMLPPGIDALPKEVQKLMACGCQATEPCGKGNCSCRTLRLTCTIFCKCSGSNSCRNPYSVSVKDIEDGEQNALLFEGQISKDDESES